MWCLLGVSARASRAARIMARADRLGNAAGLAASDMAHRRLRPVPSCHPERSEGSRPHRVAGAMTSRPPRRALHPRERSAHARPYTSVNLSKAKNLLPARCPMPVFVRRRSQPDVHPLREALQIRVRAHAMRPCAKVSSGPRWPHSLSCREHPCGLAPTPFRGQDEECSPDASGCRGRGGVPRTWLYLPFLAGRGPGGWSKRPWGADPTGPARRYRGKPSRRVPTSLVPAGGSTLGAARRRTSVGCRPEPE